MQSKYLLSILAFLVLSLVFLSPSVEAGRVKASMVVTPEVVEVGESYLIEGEGFVDPHGTRIERVAISAATPGCCSGFNVFPDEQGNFFIQGTGNVPGTYRFNAYVHNKGKGSKPKFVTSVSFEVLPSN